MKLKRIALIALNESVKSKHRYKHGAVIFKQGKILSRGFNETHRGISQYKGYWEGSCHAEIAAIIRAKGGASGSNLLVTRANYRNSRPCDVCMASMKIAGIKNVFYTQDDEIVKERIS